MVICPVAIAVGCKKCPIFKICPATRIIGDQKAGEVEKKANPAPSTAKRQSKASKPARAAKAKKR